MTPDAVRDYCHHRGYSLDYADYWASHLRCEACRLRDAGPPHHIRTRGAHGAVDEAWNLVALCWLCHRLAEQIGAAAFAEQCPPEVAQKIREARERGMGAGGKT